MLVCVLLSDDEVEVVACELPQDCVIYLEWVGSPWAVSVDEVEEPDEPAEFCRSWADRGRCGCCSLDDSDVCDCPWALFPGYTDFFVYACECHDAFCLVECAALVVCERPSLCVWVLCDERVEPGNSGVHQKNPVSARFVGSAA